MKLSLFCAPKGLAWPLKYSRGRSLPFQHLEGLTVHYKGDVVPSYGVYCVQRHIIDFCATRGDAELGQLAEENTISPQLVPDLRTM